MSVCSSTSEASVCQRRCALFSRATVPCAWEKLSPRSSPWPTLTVVNFLCLNMMIRRLLSFVYASEEVIVHCSEACLAREFCTCSKCKYTIRSSMLNWYAPLVSSAAALTARHPAAPVLSKLKLELTRSWRPSLGSVEMSTCESNFSFRKILQAFRISLTALMI